MTFGVAKLEIDNLEGLESAIASGSIAPTQISKRKPKGRIFAVDFGTNVLTYGKTDADYSVAGVFSEDQLSFGIFLKTDDSRIWSFDAATGDFGIFPASTDHAGQHRGILEYFVMTLDSSRLTELAQSEGIHFDRSILSTPQMYRPGKRWAAFSVEYAKNICSTLGDISPLLAGPSDSAGKARKFLADDMTRLFLHGLAQTDLAALETNPICLLGQRLVREAENLIWNDMDYPPDVDHLTAAVGVSRRTLYRAFKSHLGISPSRYLKLFRLSRVNLDLSHSLRADTTVAAIALNWGFANLGRFAGEYRSVFGELPSETLANTNRRSPAPRRNFA